MRGKRDFGRRKSFNSREIRFGRCRTMFFRNFFFTFGLTRGGIPLTDVESNIEYYYVWIDRGGLESQVITYWNTRVIFIRVIIEVTSNVKYHIGKLLGVKSVAREAAYILLYSPFKSRIWKTGILPQWGIKLLLSGYWKYSSRVLFENKIQPIRKPAWFVLNELSPFSFFSFYK